MQNSYGSQAEAFSALATMLALVEEVKTLTDAVETLLATIQSKVDDTNVKVTGIGCPVKSDPPSGHSKIHSIYWDEAEQKVAVNKDTALEP